MPLILNERISQAQWLALFDTNRFASPFQSSTFWNIFNSIPGFSADVFAVEIDLEIKALCVVTLQKESGIKGYFSRRAIIYGGPIINKIDEKNFRFLLDSVIKAYSKRAIYIEIRNLHDYGIWKPVYIKAGWKYLSYQNFLVDCSAGDLMYRRLGNNRKRQIKKALKSGVIIKEAENISEIAEFYKILQNLYSKKIGKPLPPIRFFEEFFRKKASIFLLVIWKETIIGGIMCPILKAKSIYEFYICGIDEEYKEQYPSVMATWAAIEYANKNRIQKFDFMGAGRKDQDYGVREFKARFGGELVEYGRFLKVLNPLLYNVGKYGLKFLSVVKK